MALGTIALIAIILTSSWLASTTADLGAKVVQARQIRISASEVLENLLNAETGQRGYALRKGVRLVDVSVSNFERSERAETDQISLALAG